MSEPQPQVPKREVKIPSETESTPTEDKSMDDEEFIGVDKLQAEEKTTRKDEKQTNAKVLPTKSGS